MASDDDLNSILESALEDFKKPQPVPAVVKEPTKTPASPKPVASPAGGRSREQKSEAKNEPEESLFEDPSKLFSSLLENPELGKKFEEEMKTIFSNIGAGDQSFNFEDFQKTMEKLAQLDEENDASNPSPAPSPQQPAENKEGQDNLSATLENLLNEAKKLNLVRNLRVGRS